MKRFIVYLCCLGLVASVALADGPTLQALKGKAAVPIKIAKLAPDGRVTESREYYGSRGGHFLVFDCFEPGEEEPTGFDTCGLEDGNNNESGDSRWHLGTTYCDPYISNDMEFDPACGGLFIYRMQVAWYWHVNGAGTGENCRIIVETFEDFDDTCQTGDPNGQGAWLGSVRLDFGYMDGDPGHYWYSDIDLTGFDWVQLPLDGAGSYNIWLLTYEDADPNTSYLCTCAQTMLWGTGDAEDTDDPNTNGDCIGRGKGAFCPPNGMPPDGQTSHQGPVQWDDDYPTDGWHQTPDECYDGTYGLCPDPLGAMWCAYTVFCGGCTGDIDGDGDTDHSDLGALLSAWCSHEGDSNWNPNADLDGDGHGGHGDLGIILGDWGCGVP